MGNACSAKAKSVKKPALGGKNSVERLKELVIEEAGSEYGDDTSIGEDYFRIDMKEPWAPTFMQKYSRKYALPREIETLHVSGIQGELREVSQFL